MQINHIIPKFEVVGVGEKAVPYKDAFALTAGKPTNEIETCDKSTSFIPC